MLFSIALQSSRLVSRLWFDLVPFVQFWLNNQFEEQSEPSRRLANFFSTEQF
jgi:hypothetical protein